MKASGFDVGTRLQEGAGTSLHRAVRASDGRAVVLKVFVSTRAADVEREHLEAMQGEAVTPLFGVAATDHGPALVLGLADNGSLKDLLGAGPVPVGRALSIAARVARALERAHGLGVLHRDVKPSNILLANEAVWLADWGLATRLPKEGSLKVKELVGSPRYVAPEQTGRTDGVVDGRADLYSLGVTLYEALAGRPPFVDADPGALVGAQVARAPGALADAAPWVPKTVERLVMRLLAKDPAERYQTAAGLAADLERAASYWDREKTVPTFELGTDDQARVHLAPIVVGRSAIRETLREAAARVEEGGSWTGILVAESGHGKTAQLDDAVRFFPAPWIVLTTKFAGENAAPLEGVRTLLDAFARHVAALPEAELRRWQRRLKESLGATVGSLVQLCPDLQVAFGETGNAPTLGIAESKARIELALIRLVGTIAKARPLAILLDDVHLVDEASRALLGSVFATPQDGAFLLLTADPRNLPPELTFPHAQRLVASALDENAVGEALVAWFGIEGEATQSLAAVVHRKTAGSPRDVRAFVEHLLEARVLRRTQGALRFVREDVEAAAVPVEAEGRVVELWENLGRTGRQVLAALACGGAGLRNQDIAAATKLLQPTTRETLAALREEGLVVSHADRWSLAHRAVGDAVRPRVSEEELQGIHGRLAAHWRKTASPEVQDARLLDIATHLARGPRPPDDAIADAVGYLMTAGQRALASLAYELAEELFERGHVLATSMPAGDLAQRVGLELARTRLGRGNHAGAEALLAELATQASAPSDIATIYSLRVDALTMGESDKAMAIAVGLEGLGRLGMKVNAHPGTVKPLVLLLLNERRLQKAMALGLKNLPDATDELALARIALLQALGAPAYSFDPNLVLYTLELTLELLLAHGNAQATPYALANHGLVVAGALGRWAHAERLAELSVEFAKTYIDPRGPARTELTLHGFIFPWRRDPKDSSRALEAASQRAFESGDGQWGSYCATMTLMTGATGGRPVTELARLARRYAVDVQRYGDRDLSASLALEAKVLGAVAAGDPVPLHAIVDFVDEAQRRTRGASMDNLIVQNGLTLYVTGRAKALLEQSILGVDPAVYEKRNFATPLVHDYLTLRGLLAADRVLDGDKSGRPILRAARKRLETLRRKAESPTEALTLLLAAEEAHLDGDLARANMLYGEAVSDADRRGRMQWVAFVYDRRAYILGRHKKDAEARIFRREAFAAYERWGHRSRARQMQAEWPELAIDNEPRSDDTSPSSTNTTSSTLMTISASAGASTSMSAVRSASSNDAFDMATIARATQAVSRELSEEGVLRALLDAACALSGAQRALLVRLEDDEAWVVGRFVGGVFGAARERLGVAKDVPEGLVRSVLRRGKASLVSDAQKISNLRDDAAVRATGARSLLGLPIVQKGNILGALYLENALLAGAFTDERVRVLEVLTSQAAIALDNAALYANLEARVEERTRSLDERTRSMRLLLDNVDQGFLVVDREGHLGDERSATVGAWFGNDLPGTFGPLLGRYDANAGTWFDVSFEQLRSGVLPVNVALAQLPQRANLGERRVSLAYQPIPEDAGDAWERVLVVITDVSALLERDRLEAHQREVLTIFERITRDPEGFREFLHENATIVERLDASSRESTAERIDVHTLKGTTALMGLPSVASVCDAVESAVGDEERSLTADERTSIVNAWRQVEAEVARFLPERDPDVRLSPAELASLVERVERIDPMLARSIAALHHERTSLRLSRLAEQAKALATRLGRGPLTVLVEDNGARVEAETFGPFWASLVHGVRNAVDHGIERPEERTRAGKSVDGRLRLATTLHDTTLELVLEDDGRGVDWDAVRTKATSLGMPSTTEGDLVEALFSVRFSTRTVATETSGRGVGMHAMREAAVALGGSVNLTSEHGHGTRLVFRFPLSEDAASVMRLRTPMAQGWSAGESAVSRRAMP